MTDTTSAMHVTDEMVERGHTAQQSTVIPDVQLCPEPFIGAPIRWFDFRGQEFPTFQAAKDAQQKEIIRIILEAALTAPAQAPDEGHPHLIAGEFQSDKYPTTPRGKVPLSVKDKTAQDLLWEYAQRRRKVDAQFADDLEIALKSHGYSAPAQADIHATTDDELRESIETALRRFGGIPALARSEGGAKKIVDVVMAEIKAHSPTPPCVDEKEMP